MPKPLGASLPWCMLRQPGQIRISGRNANIKYHYKIAKNDVTDI
jgi:hypothetical protein